MRIPIWMPKCWKCFPENVKMKQISPKSENAKSEIGFCEAKLDFVNLKSWNAKMRNANLDFARRKRESEMDFAKWIRENAKCENAKRNLPRENAKMKSRKCENVSANWISRNEFGFREFEFVKCEIAKCEFRFREPKCENANFELVFAKWKCENETRNLDFAKWNWFSRKRKFEKRKFERWKCENEFLNVKTRKCPLRTLVLQAEMRKCEFEFGFRRRNREMWNCELWNAVWQAKTRKRETVKRWNGTFAKPHPTKITAKSWKHACEFSKPRNREKQTRLCDRETWKREFELGFASVKIENAKLHSVLASLKSENVNGENAKTPDHERETAKRHLCETEFAKNEMPKVVFRFSRPCATPKKRPKSEITKFETLKCNNRTIFAPLNPRLPWNFAKFPIHQTVKCENAKPRIRFCHAKFEFAKNETAKPRKRIKKNGFCEVKSTFAKFENVNREIWNAKPQNLPRKWIRENETPVLRGEMRNREIWKRETENVKIQNVKKETVNFFCACFFYFQVLI